MKLLNIFITVLFLLVVAVPGSAHTDEKKKHEKSGMKQHGKMGHMMDQSKSHKKGHRGGHGKGHFFGSRWKDTLTDEQKSQADKMHLALKKSLNVPVAKLKVKKAVKVSVWGPTGIQPKEQAQSDDDEVILNHHGKNVKLSREL